MCQAKVANILNKNYLTPDATNKDYILRKTKDAFVKKYLLTATMESNASSFINVKTMTEGLKHDEDTVANVSAI
eukprot:14952610-Ditylum_brightwellii.AAC.2